MGEAAAKAKKAKEEAQAKEDHLREIFEVQLRKVDKKLLFIPRYPDDEPDKRYRGKYKNMEMQTLWEGFQWGHAAGYTEGTESKEG